MPLLYVHFVFGVSEYLVGLCTLPEEYKVEFSEIDRRIFIKITQEERLPSHSMVRENADLIGDVTLALFRSIVLVNFLKIDNFWSALRHTHAAIQIQIQCFYSQNAVVKKTVPRGQSYQYYKITTINY